MYSSNHWVTSWLSSNGPFNLRVIFKGNNSQELSFKEFTYWSCGQAATWAQQRLDLFLPEKCCLCKNSLWPLYDDQATPSLGKLLACYSSVCVNHRAHNEEVVSFNCSVSNDTRMCPIFRFSLVSEDLILWINVLLNWRVQQELC